MPKLEVFNVDIGYSRVWINDRIKEYSILFIVPSIFKEFCLMIRYYL